MTGYNKTHNLYIIGMQLKAFTPIKQMLKRLEQKYLQTHCMPKCTHLNNGHTLFTNQSTSLHTHKSLHLNPGLPLGRPQTDEFLAQGFNPQTKRAGHGGEPCEICEEGGD